MSSGDKCYEYIMVRRRGLGEVSILYSVVREGLAVKVSRHKQRLNDGREGDP